MSNKPTTSGGGKLSGDHYYRVQVPSPISPELVPYIAECADIIEALGMTFNEGETFKAVWRLAAARQGRGKAGGDPQYDADKVAHYGARVASHSPTFSATTPSEPEKAAAEPKLPLLPIVVGAVYKTRKGMEFAIESIGGRSPYPVLSTLGLSYTSTGQYDLEIFCEYDLVERIE